MKKHSSQILLGSISLYIPIEILKIWFFFSFGEALGWSHAEGDFQPKFYPDEFKF